MPLIDHFFSFGPLRRAIWKYWYPFLTRRLKTEEVLFLNYAFEADPPLNIPLVPEDEINRACIQLYHHVASPGELIGKNVLEVSCGHGGGASYLTRTFHPLSYTGLDLNPAGIQFCQQRHQVAGLKFVQGDAEKLPFADESFDSVINVEASHCYPHFPRFLSEVTRVLRPGGHFHYADFRFSDGVVSGNFAEWDQALAASALQQVTTREINVEVLRGMTLNSKRSLKLITRHLPKFMHGLGRDFAGITGSRVYRALQDGELSYRSYCFRRPVA